VCVCFNFAGLVFCVLCVIIYIWLDVSVGVRWYVGIQEVRVLYFKMLGMVHVTQSKMLDSCCIESRVTHHSS